jgi:hypothetical protein
MYIRLFKKLGIIDVSMYACKIYVSVCMVGRRKVGGTNNKTLPSQASNTSVVFASSTATSDECYHTANGGGGGIVLWLLLLLFIDDGLQNTTMGRDDPFRGVTSSFG